MGILKKLFGKKKTDAELKADVLKKATDHWNENSELSGFSDSVVTKKKKVKKDIDPVRKQNIRKVLKVIAEAGDIGVLPKSISDKSNIATLDVVPALEYLLAKEYAEEINSTTGTKYYLTELGKKYCVNKKYI